MFSYYYFPVYWYYVFSRYPTIVYGHDLIELATNVTLQIAVSERTRCIKILTPNNLTSEEKKDYHFLMKSMATHSFMCGMYEMDKYFEIVDNEVTKISCFKPIRILVGSERSKESFAKLTSLYPTSNAVWLVFMNTSISDFFEEVHLTFSMEVIVAHVVNLNHVEFYEVYRVDEGFPLRIVSFGTWSAEKGLDVMKGSLYSRRFDLEGKFLRIGYTENWPYTFFSPGDKVWDGLYAKIWMELQRLLNFTFVGFTSPDNSAGILENGSWNGLVGMLVRKEIDVIVSELRVTSERLEYLDFTYPLISSTYQVYFRQPGYNLRWDAIFKPFDVDVWVAIIIWVIVGTLSLSISYYFTLLYGLESNETVMRGPTETFFFMLQSLSQQGSGVIPKSITCRFLFFLSYLVSSILIPSYSASLISSLTYHSPLRPFDSFDEMLSDGRYKLYVEKNTAEFAYFSDSDETALQLVKEKLIRVVPGEDLFDDSARMVDMVCDTRDNYAYFGIAASFDAKIGRKKLTDCPLLQFTKPLSKVHESMALLKGHPYTGLINYYLHRMVENGITDNIRDSLWPIKESPGLSTWTPVNVVEVFQIFILLVSGILVSLVFFIIEKYFSIVCTTQKYKKDNSTPK